MTRCGRESAACAVFLAILPFALFWPITLGREVFAAGDLLIYNYPLLHEIARQWKLGQLPLWHPFIFGGTPLLAQMQGGVFYPFNALFLLLPAGAAFGYTILLHYSLIGVCTFAYLRGLQLARSACALGALVFMLGGFAMSHLGHVSTLRTLPWLPLILLGFDRWRQSADRSGIALGAVAVGLLVLAGHPQIPFYALLVTGAYGIWFAAVAQEVRRRSLVGLAGILGIGALIGAVQWLTTAIAVGEYMRPAGQIDHGYYDYFTHFSLHPVMLANLVFPEIVPCDGSEEPGYLGIAGLALAGIGFLVPVRPSAVHHRRFFRGLAAVALPLMLGGYTPLARLLVRIPIFGTFTAPARHWFELSFAAAVLAALGFDAILSDPERAERWTRRAACGLVLAAAGAIASVWLVRAVGATLPEEATYLIDGPFPWDAIRARLGWLIAGGVTTLAIGLHGLRRIAVVALPITLVGDLFSYTGSIYTRDDPSVYTRPPASLAALRGEREPFRILRLEQPEGTEQLRECLSQNYNGVLGVEAVNGFDSLMLRAVNDASGRVMPTYGMISGAAAYRSPQFERFMDLLNARYVFVPAQREHDLPAPRYTPVYANDLVRVYRNAGALPRLFAVSTVSSVTHRDALQALESGTIDGQPLDLQRQALVEADIGFRSMPAAATARVEIVRSSAGDVEAVVEASASAVLVHTTNFTAGWTAAVDEVVTPVFRVDGLIQGVVVPAGRRRVRFRYRPASVVWGGAASCVGVALAAWLARSRR